MPVLPGHADGPQCQRELHIGGPIAEQQFVPSAVGHGVGPPARPTDHVRAHWEGGILALHHPTTQAIGEHTQDSHMSPSP